MKVKEISEKIQNIVDLRLAMDWDNVGLLVGDENKEIENILLTIDVTRDVLKEAKRKNIDMIISYHPVIWDGLKNVTSTGPGSMVYELIRNDIHVFSIHTAMDVTEGGVNDALSEMLEMKNTQPIGDYVENPENDNYKLIVFVPEDSINKVADAMFEAGAGAIGNYSQCSYRSDGTGTFLPGEGSNPAIGKRGELEYVNEIKLESIVPAAKIENCIRAMKEAHPYEAPAFDVIHLCDVEKKLGLGRIGDLKEKKKVSEIIGDIKKGTGCDTVGIIGKENRTVKKAAVCAGSCGSILNSVIVQGCDLYLTGELKHHLALTAQEAGLTCICLSHSNSERFILKKFKQKLKKSTEGLNIKLSRKDSDPFTWKKV